MACIKHYICICTLVLAIIAFHQVVFIEGRQLKEKDFNFHIRETGNSPKPNTTSSNYKQLIGDTVEGDDRQVSGHSPGIGHSFRNNKTGPKV